MNVEAAQAGVDALSLINPAVFGAAVFGLSLGYYRSIQEGGIMSWYFHAVMRSGLPKWLRKPLGTCNYCLFFWISILSSGLAFADILSTATAAGIYLAFHETKND